MTAIEILKTIAAALSATAAAVGAVLSILRYRRNHPTTPEPSALVTDPHELRRAFIEHVRRAGGFIHPDIAFAITALSAAVWIVLSI